MFQESECKRKCLNEISIRKGEYGSASPAGKYEIGKPRYIRITDIGEDGKLNSNFTSPKNEKNIKKRTKILKTT